MRVPPTAWLAWALVFVVLEAIALYDGVANDTLTATVRTWVPAIAVFAFIGWLGIHFYHAYRGKGDER